MALDVSRLRNLRRLAISSRALREWPVGVLDLPMLERLNLKDTGIGTLPDGAFPKNEKLWSGLSLDWSNFSREHFKPAFEYVTHHPEHLVDREEMVRDYCKGELSRLAVGMNESLEGMFNRFFEQWPGADARFEAIDALSQTSGVLDRQLKDWTQRVMQTPKAMNEIVGRVTPRQLAEARREVMKAEHSDVFFEDLIQRDYWVSYLKEKYPQAFRALDEADLSQEQDDGMDVDDAKLMEQLFDLTAARNAKMIELSRQEVEAIERSSGAAPLPGTSSR